MSRPHSSLSLVLVAVAFGCGSTATHGPAPSANEEAPPQATGAPGPTAPSPSGTTTSSSPPGDASTPPPAPGACPAGTPRSFERVVIDAAAPGASFVQAVDLDGDGKKELVASLFGAMSGISVPAGEVRVYSRGASSWTPSVVAPTSAGIKFPNRATVSDVDGDGDLDVIVPYGFLVCTAIPLGGPCGGIAWFERTPAGWARHDVVANGAPLFYHGVAHVDLDGDGVKDLVTVGEARGGLGGADRAEAQWLKGTTSAARFESTPRSLGAGLGSFPSVVDVDGDGDLDIASAEYCVQGGSFAWLERTAPGTYVRRVIDDTSGPSIGLTLVPNLYGDGAVVGVGANHTNTAKAPPDAQPEGVFTLTPTADVRAKWTARRISTGIRSRPGSLFAPQGAPGMIAVGDLDGDGDLDLAVSGDGDPRVLWLEQTARGCWATHEIAKDLGQAGGLDVADLDGDGTLEIVVPVYESGSILAFKRR